jgi:hypothetical protein
MLPGGPAGPAAAVQAPRIGQRGPRRRSGQVPADHVEGGQQVVQVGQGLGQRVVIGVPQLKVGASQAETSLGQQFPQAVPDAQVADRAEVDARVASLSHLVEHARPVRHVRVVAHGDLEGTVTDRRVRHGYRPPGACSWHDFLVHLAVLR